MLFFFSLVFFKVILVELLGMYSKQIEHKLSPKTPSTLKKPYTPTYLFTYTFPPVKDRMLFQSLFKSKFDSVHFLSKKSAGGCLKFSNV